ncbi:cysteine proteinase, partial [Neolentinus lepideus HHB14362 ss-1]
NLCVTKEMKTAYDRCKARVEQIIEDCSRKRLNSRCIIFSDLEFDLEEDRDACLYGLERDATCRPPDVLRVTDIFRRPEPVLFKEGATADDLVQGQLQDCWFLAALATVCTASKDSNWIEEKICVKHDVQAGVYGFIFYRDSGWVDVIVDDLLFIHAPKYENLQEEEQNRFQRDKDQYNQVARSGSKSLYFASSGTEGETWVPLIEKAFAKLHGDYAALNYGFTCDAVESLTGGVYNCFHLHDILDKDKFWKEELMKLSDEVNKDKAKKDRVFSCLIASPSCDEDKLMLVRGLKPEHAYSIIDAIEHASTGKRFVKIRNPWGRGGEWNGPWSDGSREWTTKWPVPNTEEQVHIRAEDLHHTFGDDGQFIMEYDDFITTWSYVDRTKLFNDEWAYSSHWLNVSTRPSPSAWSPGDVSFSITIVEDTPAVIVLSQLDDRAFQELSGCYKWSLDFVVHKQGPGKEEIGRSVHERLWRRSINLELQNLAKGTYIVHVRLFDSSPLVYLTQRIGKVGSKT